MPSCDGSLLPVMSVSWARPRPATPPAGASEGVIDVVLPGEAADEPSWSMQRRAGRVGETPGGNGRRTRVCTFTIRLQVSLLSCCDPGSSRIFAANYRIAAASPPFVALPDGPRAM